MSEDLELRMRTPIKPVNYLPFDLQNIKRIRATIDSFYRVFSK